MVREEAVNILYAYKKDGSYINLELNKVLNHSKMSREDQDLLTRIVYGTLQNDIYLTYQMAPYIQKKLKPYDEIVVKMSFYQLIFLDRIPAYAIIDEAVKIIKKKNEYRAKMVNAILRNFTRNGIKEIEAKNEFERLSIQYSMPMWIVKMFAKQYKDIDLEKLFAAYLEVPSLTARINTLKCERKNFNPDYWKDGKVSPDALIYLKGNIASTSAYANGYVTVQDESSQLVARLLDPQLDSYVLDMCCAPGGKTTHIAALMKNTGKIEAYDLYEHKIKLVEEHCKRMGITNIHLHVADSTTLDTIYPKETFDAILCDGPCTGLGVIGRKPEIKYQESQNMDEIIAIQKKLLDNAYSLLKRGGKMVYSTCTLNRKENDKQIDAFIQRYPDMKKVEEKVIFPYEYHSDGFYMCKLEKE